MAGKNHSPIVDVYDRRNAVPSAGNVVLCDDSFMIPGWFGWSDPGKPTVVSYRTAKDSMSFCKVEIFDSTVLFSLP